MGKTKKTDAVARPNFLLLITDQQRGNLHLPLKWQHENLPGMRQLRKHGLEFVNAFCNSCMCTPSRSTLFTGLYPAQHGVTSTLSFGGKFSAVEPELDPSLPNMATILRPYYDPQYRGKWHMSKGGMNNVHPEKALLACEVAVFGWSGWTAPDAGEDTKLANFGGGYADHDTRYVAEAISYLKDWQARKAADPETKPFVLVVSLVNPHDVLAYPKDYTTGGYTDPKWLEGEQVLPPGWDEDLMTNFKPDAQWQLLLSSAVALGALPSQQMKLDYLNFYANLVKLNDAKTCVLLEEFYETNGGEFGKAKPLAEQTIIVRLADHGEMGLAHGGMRQKAFNAYEETLRVPMIFSNPVLVNKTGKPKQTTTLAGLIDMVPTLCGLAGLPVPEGLRGRDLSGVVRGGKNQSADSEDILFTFDDTKAGSPTQASAVRASNRIRCLRTQRWKYSRYFHDEGAYLEEYELYYLCGQGYDQNDLYPPETDVEAELKALLMPYPLEYVNLAYPNNPLMKGWPKRVKDYVKAMHAEMRKRLAEKEHGMLLLSNAELHKKRKGLKLKLQSLERGDPA